MDTTHRPMTARERAELEGLVSHWTYGARATLYVGVLVTLGWFLRTIQMGLIQSAFPLWLLATGGVGLGLYLRAGRWTGGRDLRGRIRADLDGGTMLVRRIRVAEAIEAPEIEDEGPVFFILGEDGSQLFFGGQDFARHRVRGFPWVEFEVSHAPQSEQLLRVRSSGSKFDSVQRRAPLTMTEARELGLLESDFGVLSVDWAELKGDA
ncbi:MAG: hypothetical protein OEO79_16850 [Gemmatimonadota bacterium]|nr:hypothetical protein [Gemmatimonadota bacterium]